MTENYVASFTDAWIETSDNAIKMSGLEVASFTDAWIETRSHPFEHGCRQVASFTDAWIETYPGGSKKNAFESHLLQMRGLKHKNRHDYNKW